MGHGPDQIGWRRGLLFGGLLTLLFWGCGGDNLFTPGLEAGPETVNVQVPTSIESGEVLEVRVRVVGTERVDSVVAEVEVGDFRETQTDIMAEGFATDVEARFEFSIPAAITDTILRLEVRGVDDRGQVGRTQTREVRVEDTHPPSVEGAPTAAAAARGQVMTVLVTAEDNIGLREVGFLILSEEGEILAVVTEPVTGREVERLVTFVVPGNFRLGAVTVRGLAFDLAGNEAVGTDRVLTVVDGTSPLTEVLGPMDGDQIPAQDSVLVRVRVQDDDAIDSVTVDGVAHRGDRTLGTHEEVQRFLPRTVDFTEVPMDTILLRFLQPAADSSKEDAFIRAVTFDRAGNTSRDSVRVSLLIDEVPPFVEIRRPTVAQIVGVGDSLLVETFFRKLAAPIRTGIESLRLEGIAFRGDPELGTDEIVDRFQPRTIPIDPPSLDGQVVSRFLQPTSDNTGEDVFIVASARDEWGNVGTDTVRIRVVLDTIAPEIQIQQPQAGATSTAGDSLFFQVFVSDPPGPDQSGVRNVTVDGVSHRFNPNFGVTEAISKFQARTFSFVPSVISTQLTGFVQPTGDTTPEEVWIRVRASDAVGNVRADSVRITLTP